MLKNYFSYSYIFCIFNLECKIALFIGDKLISSSTWRDEVSISEIILIKTMARSLAISR